MKDKMAIIASTLLVLGLVAFSGAEAAAQDAAPSLLSGDGGQIVLAQNKSKRSKKSKKAKASKAADEKDEESEEDSEEAEAETTEATTTSLQRGNRMEFDGRLIRGETAGSGAVFLFERAPRPLPSLVKTRSSFLGETVKSVFGDEGAEQFEESKVETLREIEKKGESEKLKKDAD